MGHPSPRTVAAARAEEAVSSMLLSSEKGSGSASLDGALAQQYGGKHVGGWVSRLPASWVPYVQLTRLSPPAALALIYFPHFFGVLLAAILCGSPVTAVLRACAVLLVGSFFFSNAAHAWNDLVDAPLDAAVARTRARPIPRGAISPRAAFVFTATQAVGAAAVLLLFPDPAGAACYTLPNILATAYYPWAKRHTHFAQLVLGACLAWGVVVGCVAMGYEPFAAPPVFALRLPAGRPSARASTPTVAVWAASLLGADVQLGVSVLCLWVACVLWSAIYDTIYAHQDVKDDTALGLKSLAVLFRRRTKPVLWLALAAMVGLLAACGVSAAMAVPYYIVALGGCALSLGAMVAMVDLADPASCWWWFRYGFWGAGLSIAGGLLSEYLVRIAWGW
ncbi:putative prenyltransferase [Lasiosphaeria ovina]|uniref:Prenyltransferase n=1 Tax=Lasiosphaeria ovina TaxID=92902 RepID=A0AAE0K6Z9_9PEZI|nr:putative prenyltransferase [Lasiosphaeria ovina]